MAKKFGQDTQLIYPENHYVQWSELQVWIGVPFNASCDMAHYTVALVMVYRSRADGLPVADRRVTRLIKKSEFTKGFQGDAPGNLAERHDDDNDTVVV